MPVHVINVLQFSALKGSKKRLWKNLKQILTIEKSVPWQPDDPTCKKVDGSGCCYVYIISFLGH